MKNNIIQNLFASKIQKVIVEIDVIVTIVKIVEIVIVISVRLFKFYYRPTT